MANFEAIFGLKINLDKGELILMGEVSNTEDLARVVRCKVDSFLYLFWPPFGSFLQVCTSVGCSEGKISEKTCFVEVTVFIKKREIDSIKEHFIEPANIFHVYI